MATTAKPFAPPFDEWLDRDPPREAHATHSKRLRARSARSLKDGERVAGSEETWGAAAHAVKAIARKRGWPHHEHRAYGVIANHIGALAGNERIGELFAAIESLHRNFYNDDESESELRIGQERLARLLAFLKEADKTVPPNADPPTDPDYRKRAAAYLRKHYRRAPAASVRGR